MRGTVPNPQLPVTVWLRAQQTPGSVWEAVTDAVRAAGHRTIVDRMRAWHLARGGAPVIGVDFSSSRIHAGLLVAKHHRDYPARHVLVMEPSTHVPAPSPEALPGLVVDTIDEITRLAEEEGALR